MKENEERSGVSLFARASSCRSVGAFRFPRIGFFFLFFLIIRIKRPKKKKRMEDCAAGKRRRIAGSDDETTDNSSGSSDAEGEDDRGGGEGARALPSPPPPMPPSEKKERVAESAGGSGARRATPRRKGGGCRAPETAQGRRRRRRRPPGDRAAGDGRGPAGVHGDARGHRGGRGARGRVRAAHARMVPVARANRLSASQFGAAAGHHDHRGVGDVLLSLLWPDFKPEGDDAEPNEAMVYGTLLESHAVDIVQVGLERHYRAQGYDRVWVEQTGTRICRERPWLCASSDGLIFATGGPPGAADPLRGTLENKCPYYKKRFYPLTPHYYWYGERHLSPIFPIPSSLFRPVLPSFLLFPPPSIVRRRWRARLRKKKY